MPKGNFIAAFHPCLRFLRGLNLITINSSSRTTVIAARRMRIQVKEEISFPEPGGERGGGDGDAARGAKFPAISFARAR
jgi:hypothetical protein